MEKFWKALLCLGCTFFVTALVVTPEILAGMLQLNVYPNVELSRICTSCLLAVIGALFMLVSYIELDKRGVFAYDA